MHSKVRTCGIHTSKYKYIYLTLHYITYIHTYLSNIRRWRCGSHPAYEIEIPLHDAPPPLLVRFAFAVAAAVVEVALGDKDCLGG